MDNNLQDMIAKAVVDIIKQKEDNKGIKVGVSARHVHLSQEHLEILFGKGHELTVKKMVSPPVRPSGELKGSATMALVGPKGSIFLNEGCIIANRHIHMTPAEAEKYGIKDNDIVDVEIQNSKPTRFYNVQVRVREDFNTEMHIDTDDANACAIKTGDRVVILEK